MNEPQALEMTPAQAVEMLRQEITRADAAIGKPGLEATLDGYTCALGLALQLGPAPTKEVLSAALRTTQTLASRQDTDALSALGPALVNLVDQVGQAGALPPTAVMEAWATVAADLGSLIGQTGLILALEPEHRRGLLENAHTRARLLDEATGHLFHLADWLASLALAG